MNQNFSNISLLNLGHLVVSTHEYEALKTRCLQLTFSAASFRRFERECDLSQWHQRLVHPHPHPHKTSRGALILFKTQRLLIVSNNAVLFIRFFYHVLPN